tara:strand:- start:447 stop:875 length:429 start_codon:yes stop_codon:yes gene_type:complete
MANYYEYKPGLGAVGEYQAAGKPFLSGAIDVDVLSSAGTTPYRVEFPSVTSWISIRNLDEDTGEVCYVAFSANGLPSQGGSNYFTLPDAGATVPIVSPNVMNLKVTEVYLEGTSNNVEIVAGLTGIDVSEIDNNWSGSAGIG